MAEPGDKEKALYFRRSYISADGLWFMKVEDKLGFDEALDLDCEVWKVMPKIQARTLKTMLGGEWGLDSLAACLTTKFRFEEYRFERTGGNGKPVTFTLDKCPWYDAIVKAGRSHLASKVGERICGTEYAAWAREFGDNIRFEMRDRLCDGKSCCVLMFRTERGATES